MSWTTTRLDRVASVQARIGWKALTADEYIDDGYAFLSTPNIKGRDIDFDNVNHITQDRYNESPDLKLQEGDVLLAKDGSTLGICNVVRSLPRPATVNGSIAVIRPRSIDPTYLRYYLESTAVRDRIELVKNGMGVPHLFQWDINRFPLFVPPIDTQQQIADFLDDQVARIDAIVRLREEQVQGLHHRCIERSRILTTGTDQPLTTPTGVAWMPAVAGGWSTRKVAQEFATGSGTTPASDHPEYFGGGIPWVNTGEIHDTVIERTSKTLTADALREYSALKVFQPGALVVAMYGQGATKGRVGLLGIPAAVNQACCVLVGRGRAPAEWAFHWFRAFKSEIVQLAVGSGQPNLNQELIRTLRLPVPPSNVVGPILRALNSLHDATARSESEMRTQIELLQERKRSLITAAVTGEVDVSTASGRGVA